MNQEKAEVFYGLRLPADLAHDMEKAVAEQDTDKSKFIRGAIRRRLKELGYAPHESHHAAAHATA